MLKMLSSFTNIMHTLLGFPVRLSTTRTRSDGVLTHNYLVCSKEGFKEKATLVDTVNLVEQSERHRRDSRYNLVFVPFTGIDNHHRSVTLAAGLISKEDVDSYTWLLTCFKNFVVRDLGVIVTDQDAAMKVAISRVFPTSQHRFCMCHITKKLQSKVGIYKCRETGFLNSIKDVIWDDYSDPKEFEDRW
ncbi:hypothetical protein QQ045_005193 [Rhodiola kirilowii]